VGKASISNMTVSCPSRRRPKSPCYGPFVGCGRPIRDPSGSSLPVPYARAILPPSLAPYCQKGLPSWLPPGPCQLAPYCYSPGGTILLLVVGWHPLCTVAQLPSLPSPTVSPLGYAQLWYCTASVADDNGLGPSTCTFL